MDNNKMFLRRSSRLSHNFDENNRNRELIEKREGGNMVKKQITHERRKSIYKDKDESLLSTDENSSTYDSDYTVSVNDDDSSVGNKRKYNKENENNKNNNNNNNNRHNRRNKNKHNNNNNNSSGDNSNAITPFYDGDKNKDNECIENVRTRKNNNYEKNNLKNNSYIDILNEDIDDEDFDIFKRSKMDRSKRISTSYKNTQYNDINLRKRKSVYVESSNSEDSNKSDDDDEEYINEESSRNNKKKKLKQTYSSSTFKNKKNFVNKKVYKNFEDFNLYENIKKNPKNLHDIIEEIYYSLFNKDTNEKVKISTFFLNFLAECSGNETLTWTVDIIDYIDKQIYLYEDIPNNNQLQNVIIGNTINNTTLSDIMTPSTVRSSNKITNMDEIIRDENNFEKVCTFKCEKLEQYLSTDLNTDVLIKIKNENNKSYKAFANFFADFSFHFDENYIYDILYICIWIFSLSVSKYRKIRFTSSLASLSILLGLCKKIRYINNHERQSRKQLMAEYTRERKNINNLTGAGRKRNSSTTITRTSNTIHNNNNNNNNNNSNNSTLDIINDDRSLNIEDLINYKNKKDTELYNIVERNLIISQLIDNINEDRKNLTILNNFLLCTYNILYKNKIKDIFIDIRIITLEYFYLYLDVLTLYFTNRKFTKLLIWILYDKDNKIKICCLKILIYLCNYYNNSNKKIFKIVELLYMSKKKLLNLIFDSDYNVRIKTFELILEMNKMKLNRTEFLHFKKTLKNKKNSAHNKKDDPHINDNTSSSEYEEDTDVNSTESEKIQNKKSIVLYNHNKRNKKNIGNKQNHDGKEDDIYVISDNMCILSTKEKKIVSNLIWFNNNNKISQMITSLIYESQIKNKIKNYEKRKHNYFDVEHNDTNSEIVKYNIIYLTKYLNKNIPTVKNFVHYFDYMKNYNENLKLYTVIDKFISGIREKLDCINNIDIIIELLCEDDISLSYIGKKKGSDKTNDKEKDMGEDENNVQLSQRFNNNDNNVIDGERVIDGEHVIDGERVTENNTETRKHSTYLSHDCDKNNSDKGRDLRKCLLYICESSYRNLQNDINEMEKNKNRKGTSASTNSNNINNINNNVNINGVLLSDKNTAHSKLNNDTNKIKKMIIYTFYIIKNSKQLIKLHQTNQEHLLLVFKILKIALYECKHIYKHEEKNNIYNFSSTIMEYFKNDIESNMNYFFNNIYIYLKETYEYLFYLLKNYKLPYYSSKYTMNIISIFLSLNDSLKGSNKLSSDLFFDLYYTYFNNFLENFLYYQKNYNMEVDRNEEDNKGEDESDTHDEHGEDNVYLLNKKRKIILISENLVNKDKNIIEAIEEEIILNLTNLIHIYTLGFNYINNDLSNYKDIKNDILKKKKNIEKSIKMLCEQDYFSIKVKEKCQSFFFKDNIINLNEFLEENLLTSYYDENDIESYTHENNIQSDQYSEDVEMSYDDNDEDINYIGKKKNKNNKQKDKNKHNNINNINKRKTMNIQDILHLNDNMTKNNKNSSYIQSEEENFQYEQNLHNLYYSSDACIHANVIIHLCLHIIKAKVNSIYYYDEDVVLHTPSSRLLLLCIDQIYIIYENYIYHLCKKRYFFNFLYNIFLHKYKNDKIDGKKNEWEKKNEGEKKNRNNQHNLNDNESNLENNIQNNNIKIEINENDKSEKNNNIDDNKNKNNKENDSNNINLEDLKKLHNLNNKKIDALKNIFIELNYIYANISTLRKDINHVLIFLIRSCNNTILRYGTFLNLMNIAQLENILLYSIEDLNKYKTLELFLNKIKNNDEIGSCMDIHIKEDMENYLDKDEEINKYKNVSRYIYKDDNILFNFVTELFKYVENMNNNNYNFVNSFLSIDISVFFPINTYTYIADMCKIYNKDVLSKNEKILEMQYMHMTLIIAQFILNCNNINIFNSCLGVLLLIHLNVKNKGLSSIALNFHNKLKKYNIDVFYEVLLCALIGLYTAYINNALEEKDLLLFSASIASRLGVKIVEKQKLPLCKFIHSCVNCALNLKNQNSFLKYILPYAQKLSLSEYQLNYLKKQILNLIDSYNVANQSHIKYENSIFEHMMLIICKKRKLNDEFKDINYENSYMNLNESIHMNISKNIINRNRQSEASTIIKTRKSVLQMNRNKDNDQVDKMNDDENKDEDNDGNNNNDSYNNDIQNDDLSDENNNIDKKKSSNDEDNINSESDINENNYVNQNMRHYRIKKELIHHENEHAEKEQTNNIHKAKDKYKRINKQNYGNEKNNSNNNEIYSELDEKSHSNSTLSDLVSLNDEDNNNNNNDKGKSHYDMNSSPKPVRSKKYNNMHVIPKYNSELNMNDTDNKSMDINSKHSVDISLNSSLGNISYKDDDNMSLISDVKGKNKYFTQNADDSNSDIVPGMSPIKKNDGKRSELSTPISYADDLMNF